MNRIHNTSVFRICSFLCAFAFIIILMTPSCRTGHNKETLQKVDSLQSYVKQAGEILIFDEAFIIARNDSIKTWAGYMQKEYAGAFSLELNAMLSKLKGIGKNYKYFVANYPRIKKENAAHEKRINDLKKDLLEGRLSEDKFNKIYLKEKELLSAHLDEVKAIAQSIYLLDNDYIRSSRYIDEFIKKDKEKTGKK